MPKKNYSILKSVQRHKAIKELSQTVPATVVELYPPPSPAQQKSHRDKLEPTKGRRKSDYIPYDDSRVDTELSDGK